MFGSEETDIVNENPQRTPEHAQNLVWNSPSDSGDMVDGRSELSRTKATAALTRDAAATVISQLYPVQQEGQLYHQRTDRYIEIERSHIQKLVKQGLITLKPKWKGSCFRYYYRQGQ